MCASSPPPAPDYSGAAATQGQANVQSAIAQNVMNRPQENTPLGSRSWNQTGTYQVPGVNGQPGIDVPTYTSNINLTPEAQGIFNTQMQQAGGMANLGNQSLAQTQQALSQPSSVGQLADQSYAAQTARLDPQWQHAQTQQETQLTNQGLVPGGEAYDNAMRVFNQGKNDAYQQARIAAQQTLPLEISARELPLNELNALRTGSQVSMPQFQGYGNVGLQAPNYQQVAQQQGLWNQGLYNTQAAQAGNLQSGLFGLGSAGILGLMLA